MKLITFTIPSYNSQDYMRKCIDPLLSGGEDVEVIIVNDGSKDDTGKIAEEYASKYPSIVKAIQQENGGHGSGVNAGLLHATGLYFKVVDSDDWVDEKSLKTFLTTLKAHIAANLDIDLYITNYVYEHVADHTTYVMRYSKYVPSNRPIGWKDIKRFPPHTFMLMHSLMYKTEKLRQSGMLLPKHTFYVDNIYAYQPLPYMSKLFYLDLNFYHYFIGRADQSVNIQNFVKRYDQQTRVMHLMAGAYRYDQLMKMEKGLRRYMFHYLGIIMLNTMLFIVGGDDETTKRKQAYKDMWHHIKDSDRRLYLKLLYRSYPAFAAHTPYPIRRLTMLNGYKIAAKAIKLG